MGNQRIPLHRDPMIGVGDENYCVEGLSRSASEATSERIETVMVIYLNDTA